MATLTACRNLISRILAWALLNHVRGTYSPFLDECFLGGIMEWHYILFLVESKKIFHLS
jgi:hypothetical protein